MGKVCTPNHQQAYKIRTKQNKTLFSLVKGLGKGKHIGDLKGRSPSSGSSGTNLRHYWQQWNPGRQIYSCLNSIYSSDPRRPDVSQPQPTGRNHPTLVAPGHLLRGKRQFRPGISQTFTHEPKANQAWSLLPSTK